MGISLRSIELSNIRSHSHFKFVPADSGVTAISGPTGSGKSTLVDSLAWILFGTKPSGVSKNSAILREGTDLKKEECFATVELEVDGKLLKMERKMVSKAGGVKCDVWEWNTETEDWDHRAGAATSHAEAYMRQRLKMDEKGFLTAVLVQQKQVDQLISAGPPERAKVIEKLTGIASISSGIVAARKEHSGLKKAIELTTVDESQLESATKELSKAEADLAKVKGEYSSAKDALQLVHGELKSFEADVESQVESFERAEKARRDLDEVETRLEASESLFADALTEKNDAKELLPQGSQGVSYSESLAELKALRSKVANLEGSKSYGERLISEGSIRIRELKATIADSSYRSMKDLKARRVELQSSIEDSRLKKRTLDGEAGELRGELIQLESAIAVVSKGDDCPTCRQSVADVSGAVKALESQSKRISKSITKLEAEQAEASELQRTLERELAELEELGRSFVALKSERSSLEEAEEELKSTTADLKARSAELKGAEKLHKIVEREEENSKRYQAALARLQKIVKTIEDLKTRRESARAVLKEGKAPSEKKIGSLRKKLYDLQVSYQNDRVALNELKSEGRILSGSIEHLLEKKELFEAEIERHRELLRSVEISAATLETLTEFRADRVKTALPTIESYASELLSRFTDGKFIALRLDEKFNASVVLSSGVERPVGMLSGGELSAASIALRLSVSMMLNSSDSDNLIILDEVLVSQDADRSELILSTIKDVCKGQVVMISHGAGVASIADRKVELTGS